jgi:hypothetical protein
VPFIIPFSVTVIEGIVSRFVAGDNPGYPADTPASKKGLYYDQHTNMFICPYSDSVRVTVVSMLYFPINGTFAIPYAIS